MSRGTDYKFVQTDTAGVLSVLVSKYEELTSRTLLPADPDRLFLSWVADVIVQERTLLNFSANQNIPSRAVGKNLDALGETIYNVKRSAAKPSKCNMQFDIIEAQESAVLIPEGTVVTDEGRKMMWATVEDALVPVGETTIIVAAECKTDGEIGNGYLPGQINTLVDTDAVKFFAKCANIDTTNSGSERLTDSQYYELMRQSLEAYSTAGPKGAYEYHAMAVSSEIADVCAINPIDLPGVVYIYAVMQDGTLADDGTKRAIFDACNADNVRPLTDMVEVLDAEIAEFNVDFTYYIDINSGKSANEISVDVEKAVEEFIKWQTAKIGRDINPSKLVWLLRDTGIKRVEVHEPVFTSLRDGSGQLTPQFAKHISTKITNGGYEDE